MNLLELGVIPIGWPGIWVIAAIIFGIIEAFTLGLATIWFCGGAVVAAILATIGAPIGVQFAMFFIISVTLLYFTRPIAQKKLNMKVQKTNADALIGKIGVVTEQIAPFSPGQVKIDGKEWTAICDVNHRTINAGERVRINKIEGVKLIVASDEMPVQ